MRWRIYYADGSTFSDRDGDAFHAPPAGAEVIVIESPKAHAGFAAQYGKDNKGTYVWRDEQWSLVDEFGFWDYMLMHIGPKAVVFGRSVHDDIFWNLVKRANAEGLGE